MNREKLIGLLKKLDECKDMATSLMNGCINDAIKECIDEINETYKEEIEEFLKTRCKWLDCLTDVKKVRIVKMNGHVSEVYYCDKHFLETVDIIIGDGHVFEDLTETLGDKKILHFQYDTVEMRKELSLIEQEEYQFKENAVLNIKIADFGFDLFVNRCFRLGIGSDNRKEFFGDKEFIPEPIRIKKDDVISFKQCKRRVDT